MTIEEELQMVRAQLAEAEAELREWKAEHPSSNQWRNQLAKEREVSMVMEEAVSRFLRFFEDAGLRQALVRVKELRR